MTAATAVNVDEITVETVECKFGRVMLTTTPDGWEILGVHKTRTFKGAPAVYRMTLTRCDCRTNPESPQRMGVRSHKYNTWTNTGTRPLCPKRPEHNKNCHNRMDHCASGGHDDADSSVRRLFADVVKSYNASPAPLGPDIRDRRTVARLSDQERESYLAWLRENDPAATNPFA